MPTASRVRDLFGQGLLCVHGILKDAKARNGNVAFFTWRDCSTTGRAGAPTDTSRESSRRHIPKTTVLVRWCPAGCGSTKVKKTLTPDTPVQTLTFAPVHGAPPSFSGDDFSLIALERTVMRIKCVRGDSFGMVPVPPPFPSWGGYFSSMAVLHDAEIGQGGTMKLSM